MAASTNRSRTKDWCKIILSGLVPFVLGVFTIVFSLQQQSLSTKQNELDRWNQLDGQQQTIFNAYINDISNLLLQISDTNKTREKKILLYVKTKTLTALRNLNSERKKYILLFLYESGFLQDSSLQLTGADFNDVQLIGPYKLDRLYLPNVFWANALFIDCTLNRAIFDQSHMINARFINSSVERASFRETLMNNVHFVRTSVFNVNFTGASLVQGNFLEANIVQTIDFTNADLLNAHLTHNQFNGIRISIQPNKFDNARLPNGSFGPVNSTKNLIKNGDAEMQVIFNLYIFIETIFMVLYIQCPANRTKDWQTIRILNGFNAVPINMTDSNPMLWGKCMFRLMNETARVSQYIDLRSYSLLVSMNKAMYSASGFIGCTSPTNASYIEITSHDQHGNLLETQMYLDKFPHSFNGDFMVLYAIKNRRIPEQTTQMRVSLGIRSIFDADNSCYFDNLTFAIQEYKL